MSPVTSAGSNQLGASETCTPQVSSPLGSAPSADAPATKPKADKSSNWRRLTATAPPCGPGSLPSRHSVMSAPPTCLVFCEDCRISVADLARNVSGVLEDAKSWEKRPPPSTTAGIVVILRAALEDRAMAAQDEAVDWAGGLDALVDQIAPRFRRVEPRRRVW